LLLLVFRDGMFHNNKRKVLGDPRGLKTSQPPGLDMMTRVSLGGPPHQDEIDKNDR
jgi:hypothetical protein